MRRRRKEKLGAEELERRRQARRDASASLVGLPQLCWTAHCPVCGRGWISAVRHISHKSYVCPPPADCREKFATARL